MSPDFSQVRRCLLVGAGGITGKSYAALLIKNGVSVYAYDRNEKVTYDAQSSELFHVVSREDFESLQVLDYVDSVTLSPGVPLQQPVFLQAKDRGKFVFTEVEYAYEFLRDKKWVGVTGTDGKSTTVALMESCAKALGLQAVACGNFGLSFSKIALEKEKYASVEYLFAEFSSYQLESIRNVLTDAAVYLNLSPDHLDRYESIDHYGLVKWHLMHSLKKDAKGFINEELLPGHSSLWRKKHPCEYMADCSKITGVDCDNLVSENFFWVGGGLFRHPNQKDEIVKLENMKIRGRHNQANILFVLETLLSLIGDLDVQKVKTALESFSGLPHRFEKISSTDGNLYINDSKATTTQASLTALKNIQSPVFVFLGGRSKGEDYSVLAAPLKEKEAAIFLFGENRDEIANALMPHEPVFSKPTLEEAFSEARQYQKRNNLKEVTYLLSPASTSWDQYASFEKRGDDFRQLVENIPTSNN